MVAVGYNNDDQCDVSDWRDIVAVAAGAWHTVGLKSDGTVVATEYKGYFDDGQCDVFGWTDIVAVAAGSSHTVGLKSDGTVVATEYKSKYYNGQCDVSSWNLFNILDTLAHEQVEARRIEAERAPRRAAGRCQHCGGELKGLFGKKCASCGKPKDY